jgi:hypothetical protein
MTQIEAEYIVKIELKGKILLAQTCLIITLGFVVALFCSSCSKEFAKSKEIPVVIQGDEASKRELEEIIKAHPEVVHPQMGIKYHLQIIKPDPNIDYKIVQVKPDPNIHYKIIIIDPQTGNETPELTEDISKNILKSLQQKKEQKKR